MAAARPAHLALALLALVASAAAGCGANRRDANERSGTWKVDVLSATFPGNQRLAQEATLKITVKNLDTRAIPDLAVTVDGFNMREENRDFADPTRPIWVLESPPQSSTTAYTNTWTVGRVPPGQKRTLVWRVNAVRAGTYPIRYRVSAGLNGKAKAALPDGSPPAGSFTVHVSARPRAVHID
jgi:hypothetical protein